MWGCSLRPLEHFWISGRILHLLFSFPTWATTPKYHQCDSIQEPLTGPPGTLRGVRSAFLMDTIDGLTSRARAPQRPVRVFGGFLLSKAGEGARAQAPPTLHAIRAKRYVNQVSKALRSSLAHLSEDLNLHRAQQNSTTSPLDQGIASHVWHVRFRDAPGALRGPVAGCLRYLRQPPRAGLRRAPRGRYADLKSAGGSFEILARSHGRTSSSD